MTTRTADAEGFVTDDSIAWYLARARGGTGLITVEMASPERAGRHRIGTAMLQLELPARARIQRGIPMEFTQREGLKPVRAVAPSESRSLESGPVENFQSAGKLPVAGSTAAVRRKSGVAMLAFADADPAPANLLLHSVIVPP